MGEEDKVACGLRVTCGEYSNRDRTFTFFGVGPEEKNQMVKNN